MHKDRTPEEVPDRQISVGLSTLFLPPFPVIPDNYSGYRQARPDHTRQESQYLGGQSQYLAGVDVKVHPEELFCRRGLAPHIAV